MRPIYKTTFHVGLLAGYHLISVTLDIDTSNGNTVVLRNNNPQDTHVTVQKTTEKKDATGMKPSTATA